MPSLERLSSHGSALFKRRREPTKLLLDAAGHGSKCIATPVVYCCPWLQALEAYHWGSPTMKHSALSRYYLSGTDWSSRGLYVALV